MAPAYDFLRIRGAVSERAAEGGSGFIYYGLHRNIIYMYAMTQYKGDAMPPDIRQESLTKYEMGLLNDFRRWIFKRRREASRERLRAVKREEREAKKAEKEAAQREIEDARPELF